MLLPREAERAGRLTESLMQHRLAFELYRGEFMPGVTDADVEQERLRLQTLAYSSGCRLCELLLAKGEPEEALRRGSRRSNRSAGRARTSYRDSESPGAGLCAGSTFGRTTPARNAARRAPERRSRD